MSEINKLLDAKMLEHSKHEAKRNYLGASQIGDECLRKIQLQYLGKDAEISAQTLRTFAIGTKLEDLVADWIRISGIDLKTRNDEGKQFGFCVADGKIAGHVDGIIYAFPDEIALKAPALWECKTMNHNNWRDTAKRGMMVAKTTYYAQIQLYMAYMKLTENPCLFTALDKDTSELYFELIPFDAEAAQRYSNQAVQIIKASENGEFMPYISNDPSFFRCKMCGFRNICRGNPTDRGERQCF